VDELTLSAAQHIVAAALKHARGQDLQPLCVVVLTRAAH
jgi:uncharacterized protein GlcG (DUF336 family)